MGIIHSMTSSPIYLRADQTINLNTIAVLIMITLSACHARPSSIAEITAVSTDTPATHWSVEDLTPEGSLLIIEAAGSYEGIGYAVGTWYRDRGYTPRLLNEQERSEARSLLDFYADVHPSLSDQLRGMYAAFKLDIENLTTGIPIYEADGVRVLLPGLVERDSCSVVFAGPEIAADRHPRLGRNYDLLTKVLDLTLMFTYPDDGYPTAIMTPSTPGLSAADGINSEGLALGFASVDDIGYEPPPGPALISGLAYRFVLEHSANVEEAIATLQSIPISFIPSSPEGLITHILLADRSGASAVVEFLPEGIVVSPTETPYQVMTNTHWAGPADQLSCDRYRTAIDLLERERWSIDSVGLMTVLSEIRSSTQWSIVYDLQDLSMTLALPGDGFSTSYDFSLAEFIDRMAVR
jgi:predicted choloylglycine hydrolase